MVLEQHGDVAGTLVVDRAEAAAEEVGQAHALVAITPEGPRAIVLAKQDAAGDVRMIGAGLDLRPEQERCVERMEREADTRNLLGQSGRPLYDEVGAGTEAATAGSPSQGPGGR